MDKSIVEFIRSKDYKVVREIGQGGTGKTILIKDEIIDESFVCKKYSPYNPEHRDMFFNNFIDEIKILHKLFHKNLVRVFNYYLYPKLKTGYILMEYVEGENIASFIAKNPHLLNDIFAQTISGFSYLEQNKILHRDIRPENILVSNDGNVKIIDFGFGKRIKFDDDFNKSITLNWRYFPPKDFENKNYDFRTEIYFVGKLFEEIINEYGMENFAYSAVLNNMIKVDFDERISRFTLAEREILNEENKGIDFSEEEKSTYKRFAIALQTVFRKIEIGATYNTDIDKIISNLEGVYRNSMLEEFIQNPRTLSRCFVSGEYFFNNVEIPLAVIKDFVKFLNSVSIDKRRIILNNLWQRLDSIERYTDDVYDLPF